MSDAFTGHYFDGNTLRSRPVRLRAVAGRLHLEGLEPPVDVSLADVRVSDRLGAVPCFLYLPDRQCVETHDQTAIAALLALRSRHRMSRLIHWLEARARVAAAATVLLVLLVAGMVYWGLPVLAEKTALAVPDNVEVKAGQAALNAFARFLQPSQLGPADRVRVIRLLDRLMQQQKTARKVRVEFRSMGGKYPNAFALPGGIIVVSDELVQLAANDEELMAVFAHELGHIECRHGLQSVLRGSAALLLVSTVTGDLSTLSSFSATIPLTLLQRGYSREFEIEADDYARAALQAAKVDRWYFVSILEKLEKSRGDDTRDFSYLSTHPNNADRIRRISPAGTRPSPVAVASAATDDDGPVEAIPAGTKDYVPPQALRQPGPVYPQAMADRGVAGSVTVEFVINKNGDVIAPRLIRSTHQEFEAPALAAIRRWKFLPGQLRGMDVNVRASQIIEFNFEDPPRFNPADAPQPAPAQDAAKPADLSLRGMTMRPPPPKR